MRKYVSSILFNIPHNPLTPSLFSCLKRFPVHRSQAPRVFNWHYFIEDIVVPLCWKKGAIQKFQCAERFNNDSEDFPFLSGLWACRSQTPSHVSGTDALVKFTTQQVLERNPTPAPPCCSDTVSTPCQDFRHPPQGKDLNSHFHMHIFHYQLVSPCTLNLCQVISHLFWSPARHSLHRKRFNV